MQEQVVGVFTSKINFLCPLSGKEVIEVVEQAAGKQFHKVHYYNDADGYVIGRRTGYGLGGDIIVRPNLLGESQKMWREDVNYTELRVWDGLWNDDVVVLQKPPSDPKTHPNDLTIESCLAFTSRLKEALNQRCNAKMASATN